MENQNYTYCPRCATELTERLLGHKSHPTCPACNFIQFQDPKVAVIAFVTHVDPATQENRVLLIQRAVDPAKGKWAMPGGYMDADEMPEDALQRELLEEVGLKIQIEQLLNIFPMPGADGINRGILLAYQARPADPSQIELYPQDDVCAASWLTRSEISKYELAFQTTGLLLEEW